MAWQDLRYHGDVGLVRPAVRGLAASAYGSAAFCRTRSARWRKTGSAAERDVREPASRGPVLFGLLTLLVIVAGWAVRNDGYTRPESGTGYWLGIVAAGATVLLMTYSLRKRLTTLHSVGSLAGWFRIHMILGVLAPVAALLHSSYQPGSTNGLVALASMLLVAASGLVGSLLYTRIHHGLYGRRATLTEVRRGYEIHRERVRELGAGVPAIAERLQRFEDSAGSRPKGPLRAVGRLLFLKLRARLTRRKCLRYLRKAAAFRSSRGDPYDRADELRIGRRLICTYVDAVCRVARFAAYERLFSLWHAFHVPLFLILILSTVAHVVAVHLY